MTSGIDNQELRGRTRPDCAGDPCTLAPSSSPVTDERYRVGTLQYTRMSLAVLFGWLLWGDFCFTVMETVIPSVLPLKLKSLDAPNWLMALLITTIPSAMNFMINPVISFKSDRYRSRWGRRIPFLLLATPLVTLFLIAMGCSEDLGRWLHGLLSRWLHDLRPQTMVLILIGVLMVAFQFFNLFINTVYYYLFNDVVPRAFLARCMALFRVVGAGAGSLYTLFVYRYAGTHMREIFLGAGLLYFVSFMAMCWKVREGGYPPPPPLADGRRGIRASIKTYATECFVHPIYWYFFLANTFTQMATCIAMFTVFLYRDSLGLTLSQLGTIGGTAGIVSTALLYPAGMMADRFHPIRVMVAAKILTVTIVPASLIYLFFSFDPAQVLKIYIVYCCFTVPIGVMYNASALPMYMSILPRDRYGQFSSADAMVRSIGMIVGSLAAGFFMDTMKTIYHGNAFYYRYIPLWTICFETLALTFLLLLYREWKQRGSQSNAPPQAL